MLHERCVDGGTAGRPQDGHELRGGLLGGGDAEALRHRRQEADQGRGGALGRDAGEPSRGEVLRRLSHQARQRRTDREVARLSSIIARRRAAQREHRHTLQPPLGCRQVLPLSPSVLGDGPQHQRRRDGQLDGEAGQAHRSSGRPRGDRQPTMQPVGWIAAGLGVQGR